MMCARRAGPVTILLLLAAACGSTTTPPDASSQTLPLRIANHGGSLEGHTPRGFAGSGVGLFAGDNLNPGFPNGDGVQIWLTFDLPTVIPEPTRAVVSSRAMTVQGAPFEDLGPLRAEPVTYAEFGPALFDLPADGPAVRCQRIGGGGIECDVTESVSASIAVNARRVQFRLKFDIPGDGDGQQDLALFFLTDSNTNEMGTFTLELE